MNIQQAAATLAAIHTALLAGNFAAAAELTFAALTEVQAEEAAYEQYLSRRAEAERSWLEHGNEFETFEEVPF